jgi:hypothetical protein
MLSSVPAHHDADRALRQSTTITYSSRQCVQIQLSFIAQAAAQFHPKTSKHFSHTTLRQVPLCELPQDRSATLSALRRQMWQNLDGCDGCPAFKLSASFVRERDAFLCSLEAVYGLGAAARPWTPDCPRI